MNIGRNVKFGLVQGSFWMAYCLMFPFLVKLYAYYGYSDLMIGVFSACTMVANLAAQPLWGALCDRLTKIKPLLVGSTALAAASSLLLPLGRNNPVMLIVAIVLMSGTLMSMTYIIDMWCVRLNAAGAGIVYGFTRSFGSLFYAVTAVIYGIVLDAFSYDVMSWIFIGGCAVMIACALGIDESSAAEAKKKLDESRTKRPSMVETFKELVKNKKYMFFLASYFFISFGNTPMNNYLPRKFEELGAGSGIYGLALFVIAASEIPMLLVLARLIRRFGAEKMLKIAFVGCIVRVLAISLVNDPVWLVVAQVTEMPSLGIYIGSSVAYMAEIVPQDKIFTAQTIYAAIAIGFSGILGNLTGGALSDALGVIPMIMCCIIPVTIGTAIFFLSGIRTKKAGELIKKAPPQQ